MINIAKASSITPVLMSIPPTCCGKYHLNAFVDVYNAALATLAAVNEIALAQTHHAFVNTCELSSCYLLNRPEGVHPNTVGYDVQSEAVMAALLGINLFAPDGAAQLEAALGLPAGSVKTQPDPLPPES